MDPNLLDIIIILTMLVSGLLALTQGFVKEILSLMGWIVSFVSVILLMPEAGNYLKPFFGCGLSITSTTVPSKKGERQLFHHHS